MPTLRAILRRVGRVHGDLSPTGPGRRVREKVRELAPRCVLEARGEAMGLHHPIQRQVFNGKQVNLMHNASAVLVGKIAPPPRAALLDTRHHRAPRCPFRRALLLLAEAALGLGERLRFFTDEAWVGNRLLGAEHGAGLEAHVKTSLLPRLRQRRRRSARAREAHLPLAAATARERRRLGRAFQGPVVDQLDAPTIHDVQALGTCVQLAAHRPLRAGEAGVASRPTTAGIAGLLTRSTAAEEGLTGPVSAPRHVLQHRRLDTRQRGPLRFAGGQRRVLIVEAHRLLPLLPRIASFRKQVVVQPAALRKVALQEALLFFVRIQAVAERLTPASIVA